MKEVFKKIRERLEAQNLKLKSMKNMCIALSDKEVSAIENHAYNTAIEIVNQVESEYNNGWIPCSERLPKRNELVLIYAESTARGGSIRCVAALDNGFWFTQTSSDTLSLNGIGQYNVIAWQTLPDPYRGDEE